MQNLDFIKQVHLNDIPWHRLSTPYDRADQFPEWFKQLTGDNHARADLAAQDIALNIEHQSALWQVTPFAMIILSRILTSAIDKYIYTKEDDDITAIKRILEIYVPIFNTVQFMDEIVHDPPLPHFSDMLNPKYLMPEDLKEFYANLDMDFAETEDEEDLLEIFLESYYMEIPGDLFYSFFYYAWMVLAFSLNHNTYKLIEINSVGISSLLVKMSDKKMQNFLNGLMYV